MKHKKNYITRIYTFLHILEYLIIYNNSSKLLLPSPDVEEIFLDMMTVNVDDVDLVMHSNLITSYETNKVFINESREQCQQRCTATMDLSIKTMIDLALAEYLHYHLDKKLIINIYVNITSIFDANGTKFVHGVLDKAIDYLENKKCII